LFFMIFNYFIFYKILKLIDLIDFYDPSIFYEYLDIVSCKNQSVK
jgi:hypothetical protein